MWIQTDSNKSYHSKGRQLSHGVELMESVFMFGNQRCLCVCWNISWKHDVIYTEKTKENSPTAMLSLISFSMLTSFVQSVLTSLFQKKLPQTFSAPRGKFLSLYILAPRIVECLVGNWCCKRKRLKFIDFLFVLWRSPITTHYRTCILVCLPLEINGDFPHHGLIGKNRLYQGPWLFPSRKSWVTRINFRYGY